MNKSEFHQFMENVKTVLEKHTEKEKIMSSVSDSGVTPAFLGFLGKVGVTGIGVYAAMQAYMGLSAQAASSFGNSIAPSAAFVPTMGTALAVAPVVAEKIRDAVHSFVETRALYHSVLKYEGDRYLAMLSKIEQGIEKGHLTEFLSKEEVERCAKDSRYIVLNPNELDTKIRLDFREDEKEKCNVIVKEAERFDAKEYATAVLRSDMIGYGIDGQIVLEKETASVQVFCGNKDTELLVRDIGLQAMSNSEALEQIAKNINNVLYFDAIPRNLLEEVSVKHNLLETVVISVEKAREVEFTDSHIKLCQQGKEPIVLRKKDNKIEKAEDGSIVIKLCNPFAAKQQKEQVDEWNRKGNAVVVGDLSYKKEKSHTLDNEGIKAR